MRFPTACVGVAALARSSTAAFQGFNYGAFFLDQSPKQQVDFEYEFNRARSLPGTSGWTAARLYTMVQWGTQRDILSAIPAAINTQTPLLLGLWASGGLDNELAALQAAIGQYGTAFSNLVIGISVGSEDLYRNSFDGIQANSGVGAEPQQIIDYIGRVRQLVAGTGLAGTPVGHVDTWTAFNNDSNAGVIAASDFLGMDAYPYFQTTMANSVEAANQTFFDAFDTTIVKAQGKPVWVTETGWPVSGATQNLAVASGNNARTYWQDVACGLIARGVNLFWYILQESQFGQANPDFGLFPPGDLQQVPPYFDLSC